MAGLTPYCVRKSAGLVAQMIATAPGASVWLVGKMKSTPSDNSQRLVGRNGSYSGTLVLAMFTISTYSEFPLVGLYMISLNTTGPMRGRLLVPPWVVERSSVKSTIASERV